MNRLVPSSAWLLPIIAAIVVGALSASIHAAPLTISFIADRDVAGRGETVYWTVWAELPDDAPDGAEVLGFSGDFRPRTLFSGVAFDPIALAFAERTSPTIQGAAISGVEVARSFGTSGMPRRFPLYAFATEIASDERPLWYDLDAVLAVSTPQGVLFYQRDDGLATMGEPIRVVSDTVNLRGCGQADIAEPFNQLTQADIDRFIQYFNAGAPLADFVRPYGVVDFADLSRFMLLYSLGCYQQR